MHEGLAHALAQMRRSSGERAAGDELHRAIEGVLFSGTPPGGDRAIAAANSRLAAAMHKAGVDAGPAPATLAGSQGAAAVAAGADEVPAAERGRPKEPGRQDADPGEAEVATDPVEALAVEVLTTPDADALAGTLRGMARPDRDALHAAIVQRALTLTRGGQP